MTQREPEAFVITEHHILLDVHAAQSMQAEPFHLVGVFAGGPYEQHLVKEKAYQDLPKGFH